MAMASLEWPGFEFSLCYYDLRKVFEPWFPHVKGVASEDKCEDGRLDVYRKQPTVDNRCLLESKSGG